MKHTVISLAVIAGLMSAAAIPAQAAENNDRFTLRVGAMDVDGSSTLTANTVFDGADQQFSQDFDFGSKEIVPRVDGVLRFGNRSRLVFDYFKYDKDRDGTLESDLSFDDTTLPAGSFANAEIDFKLATLMYDFAVVDNERFSLGLQVGAEWAKLEGKLHAEAGEDVYDSRSSEDGFAPVVGARLTFTPSDKWLINVQGQYLNANWGSFDNYDGSITRANALVEYRLTRNFGLFAGYDWFKLDATRNGGDGALNLDQRFKGPVAGVSFAF